MRDDIHKMLVEMQASITAKYEELDTANSVKGSPLSRKCNLLLFHLIGNYTTIF